VKSVTALSADADGTQGSLPFEATDEAVDVTVPRLVISTILVIE
jgi:hypothetical protein